ncbi:hypothetical protein A3B18_03065 [Candidatus Giovannonibacteria bacterium RIFCSPLOWO2_01_FULL_46_13]|uniref:Uncharacterized protein n=1 Tax=Candidatus Giovannonibacteria bacterium RIFCSPLOWO2_01_FULL_46_13 TaxID=1798352 RepID=A0A1F5X333_9BACT|nr:MAG: hypothetical protein A3B18_03065 [Candidatus Giovannonibacteria bacterium RIFCSPLOWO2_01_FULL_46_13]
MQLIAQLKKQIQGVFVYLIPRLAFLPASMSRLISSLFFVLWDFFDFLCGFIPVALFDIKYVCY